MCVFVVEIWTRHYRVNGWVLCYEYTLLDSQYANTKLCSIKEYGTKLLAIRGAMLASGALTSATLHQYCQDFMKVKLVFLTGNQFLHDPYYTVLP